ncbi:hypothetical protein AC578_8119 [Pseudocercospora eumusae]|uniref:Uncharacterized protein n=1 Tax=Pseudocercospora eumusae TaxID=321146 RepID=A0A139HAE2_9PEZI|nr:hypothetical protein AC578_8119 [Pseudocercospora eumusae]
MHFLLVISWAVLAQCAIKYHCNDSSTKVYNNCSPDDTQSCQKYCPLECPHKAKTDKQQLRGTAASQGQCDCYCAYEVIGQGGISGPP